MACKDCDEVQLGETSAYYRWKNANVEIRACRAHLKEIFDVLNAYQTKDK